MCKAVGPSESREGLRSGMACGRISEGERPREEVRREEEEEAALRGIGGKEGRVNDGQRGRQRREC